MNNVDKVHMSCFGPEAEELSSNLNSAICQLCNIGQIPEFFYKMTMTILQLLCNWTWEKPLEETSGKQYLFCKCW